MPTELQHPRTPPTLHATLEEDGADVASYSTRGRHPPCTVGLHDAPVEFMP